MTNTDPTNPTADEERDPVDYLVDTYNITYSEAWAMLRSNGVHGSERQRAPMPWPHEWVPAGIDEFSKGINNGKDPTDIVDLSDRTKYEIRQAFNVYDGFRNSALRSKLALSGLSEGDSLKELPDVRKALVDYLIGILLAKDAIDTKEVRTKKLAGYVDEAKKTIDGMSPEEIQNTVKAALESHTLRAGVWSEAVRILKDRHPFIL